MRLFLLFSILLLTIVSCQKDQNFEKFIVDKNLRSNDTIKLLSKYPELKLFNNETVESEKRTAYIVQTASYFDQNQEKTISFDDYKCRARYKNDTLYILLNNNNGYFGNGVLIQVFNNQFNIKNIDPKTLKNGVKYIKVYNILAQRLILNSNTFKKNDSIYGFIDYRCSVDHLVHKHFKGYFKTQIN